MEQTKRTDQAPGMARTAFVFRKSPFQIVRNPDIVPTASQSLENVESDHWGAGDETRTRDVLLGKEVLYH